MIKMDKDKEQWDKEFDDFFDHQYDDEILTWKRKDIDEIDW